MSYGQPPVAPGPLDGLYANKNKVMLIIGAVCPCTAGIVFILSLIAFLTAKSEEPKANAKLLLIIWAVMFVLGIVINFAFGGLALIMGGGR